MPNTLIREYQQFLGDGPIDLFGFFSSRSQTPSEERLKVILHDLRERWKSSQPWKVEDYLERFSEYASDSDAIIALIKTERIAQLGIDTTPEISEFTQLPAKHSPLSRWSAHSTSQMAYTRKCLPSLNRNECRVE